MNNEFLEWIERQKENPDPFLSLRDNAQPEPSLKEAENSPFLKSLIDRNRQKIKKAVISLLSAILIALPAYAEKVCSVHDGDTITLCDGLKVRLWGADAPELKQTFGQQSRDTLKALVLNQDVKTECLGKSYQRSVCRVFLGPLDVGGNMVRAGYAYDSPQYSRGLYRSLQVRAQCEKLGVWSQAGQVAPWVFRAQKRRSRGTELK